jgi:dUTP pyrophosphatase
MGFDGVVLLKLKRLSLDAIEPEYKSAGASGFDLFACCGGDMDRFILAPKAAMVIPTGWAAEIPAGYELQIRPRSGMSLKRRLILPNSPGTIDSDYRGEIGVILRNLSDEYQSVLHGERIAQAVLSPVFRAEFLFTDDLSETARGSGGYGSTGAF